MNKITYKLTDNIYSDLYDLVTRLREYAENYNWLVGLEEQTKEEIGVNETVIKDAFDLYKGAEAVYYTKVRALLSLIKFYYANAKRIEFQYSDDNQLRQEVLVWLNE